MKSEVKKQVCTENIILTPMYRSISLVVVTHGNIDRVNDNFGSVVASDPDVEFNKTMSGIIVSLPFKTLLEGLYGPRLLVKLRRSKKQKSRIKLDITIENICSIKDHSTYLMCLISACLKDAYNGDLKILKTSVIFKYFGGPAADGFYFDTQKREINYRTRSNRYTKRVVWQHFSNQESGLSFKIRKVNCKDYELLRRSTQIEMHASSRGPAGSLQFMAEDFRHASRINYVDYVSAHADGIISDKQLSFISKYGMQRFFWRLKAKKQDEAIDGMRRYSYLIYYLSDALELDAELEVLDEAFKMSYIAMYTSYMRAKNISIFLLSVRPNMADVLSWAKECNMD